MKIVYSAGNRFGAAHQLTGFLRNTQHQVRIAAYPKSGRLVPFYHWNLEAVENVLDRLRDDIEFYDPDCVVIDGEPIVARIADQLSLPILYCSPLHALDGLCWKRGQLSYYRIIDPLRKTLVQLPAGVSRLISSPLSLMVDKPDIKKGFEWILPYCSSDRGSSSLIRSDDERRTSLLEKLFSKKIGNLIVTSGETHHILGSILAQNKIMIAPSIDDAESIVNAIVCSQFGVGPDIGQVELMGRYATDIFDNAINLTRKNYSINCELERLHERIDSLWECM